MNVTGISTITTPQVAQTASQAKTGGEGFGDLFTNAINRLSQMENDANTAATGLATGDPVEIHDAMVAMEEANLGFQLALQVRNKLIDAYQEVMRMPV